MSGMTDCAKGGTIRCITDARCTAVMRWMVTITATRTRRSAPFHAFPDGGDGGRRGICAFDVGVAALGAAHVGVMTHTPGGPRHLATRSRT